MWLVTLRIIVTPLILLSLVALIVQEVYYRLKFDQKPPARFELILYAVFGLAMVIQLSYHFWPSNIRLRICEPDRGILIQFPKQET